MSRLEDLLVVADPHEVFPPTPALDVRVERALTRRRRRNVVLIAAVIVAAVTLAALASPSARSALSSWFRIGGVTIEQRDELPPVDYRRRPGFGERLTLEQARAIAPFHVRVLPADRLGAPTAVYIRRAPGMVTLVYGSPERPRLLLSQWRGARYGFLKVLPHGTAAEPVSLGFGVGYWVPDAHAFHYNGPDGGMYEERFYLSAPALVWAERVTMFRLEGEMSRAEALELARSLR